MGSLRLFVGLCRALAARSVFANGYEYLPGGRYRPSIETLGRIDTALFGGTCYYVGTQTPIDCRLDFKVLGLADVHDWSFSVWPFYITLFVIIAIARQIIA